VLSKKRDTDGRRKSRKEGAAYHIREECERLVCETMKSVFLGEEGHSGNGSILMGANAHTPPDESVDAYNDYFATGRNSLLIDAWIEVWDYAGGCSFRGFVGGDGDQKSLFAFFDSAVVGRDLKQG